MSNATATRTDIDWLTVFFPAGHAGSKRTAARLASQSTGVPQSRIIIDRCPEWQIGTTVAAENLSPWTDDYTPVTGREPYLMVTGAEVFEGVLDRDGDQHADRW